jgi:hypothetical protein
MDNAERTGMISDAILIETTILPLPRLVAPPLSRQALLPAWPLARRRSGHDRMADTPTLANAPGEWVRTFALLARLLGDLQDATDQHPRQMLLSVRSRSLSNCSVCWRSRSPSGLLNTGIGG